MNWKEAIRRAARGLAYVSLSAVLLAALLFGLAQTGSGKQKLGRFLALALQDQGVEIGELSGLIPFNFQIDHLAMSDPHGQWMISRKIQIRWSSLLLFKGYLHFPWLRAQAVEVLRPPERGSFISETSKKRPPLGWLLTRLRVENFDIDQILVGKAFLGREVSFTMKARFMASTPAGDIETVFRLEQTGGGNATLKAKAIWRLDTEEFSVDARFEEPQGGALAKVMGLDGPLDLSLQGQGLARDWTAKLQGQVGPLATIDSQVRVEKAEDIRVTLTSGLGINRDQLPSPLAPWVGKEAELAAKARFQAANKILFEQFTLKTENAFLEFKGLLDLERPFSNIEFVITSQDLSPLEALVNSRCAGSLTAKGRLSGTPYQPKAMLDLELHNAGFDRFRAASADAHLNIDLLENGKEGFPRFKIKGNGIMQELALDQSTVRYPKAIQWAATVEVSGSEAVRISHLELDADRMSALLAGEINTEGPRGHLDVSLELADTRPLSDALGLPLPSIGNTILKASIKGDAAERAFTGSIQGKGKMNQEAFPALAPFMANEAAYAAQISFNKDHVLFLSGAQLETGGAALHGDLRLDFQKESIKSTWHLTLPQLNLLSAAFKHSLHGSVDLEGTMEGPLQRINTVVALRGQDLFVEGVFIEKAIAHLRANGLPPDSRGHISLELTREKERLTSESDFRLDRSRLSLTLFSLEGMGGKVEGGVNLDFDSAAAQGELKGDWSELSTLAPFLGRDVSGSAKIHSVFRMSEETRELDLDLEGRNLKVFNAHLQDLRLHAHIAGKADAPKGSVSLKIQELRSGDLSLPSVAITASSDGRLVSYTASMRGLYKETFEMETSGTATPFSETQKITVARLNAKHGEIPLKLLQPATFVHSPGSISLDHLVCLLGEGQLQGNGILDASQLAVNVELDGFPMEILQFYGFPRLSGTAKATLALHGSPKQPEGEAEIHVDQFGAPYTSLSGFPPAALKLRGSLRENRLSSHLALEGPMDKPLEAELELPLVFSVAPAAFSFLPAGEVLGRLHSGVDLARLSTFLGLDDQTMEGAVQINLDLEGTVRNPRISGYIRADRGAYENLRTGTVLKDVNIEIEAESPKLRIKHAVARDGENGILTAEGGLDFSSAHDLPFKVDVALQRAELLRHDAVVVMAGGNVTLSGDLRGAILSGQISIDSAELRIPRRLPPEVTELEVVEISGGKETVRSARSKKSSLFGAMGLDLGIKIPGRVLLSGRGLESEWKGDLTVKGTVSQPMITGKLSVVRGRFDFLGKRFDLTRGSISFTGSSPPLPFLDVASESKAKDMVARLEVSGPLLSPELKLTSEPMFPPDEILARLLFARRLNQITPVQAIQLADAINTFASGGGLDIMGQSRRLLGVDQLEITQSSDNLDKPKVKIGKYISETVYVEVEKGISPETGKASVQWQVTPDITVDTEVGVTATAGMGVSWKWDY